MTSIYTGGGAITPSHQFTQHIEPKTLDRFNTTEMASKVLDNTLTVWDSAQKDLARIGSFIVNGKEIYDTSQITEKTSPAEIATQVFDELLLHSMAATQKDEYEALDVAVPIAHLVEQHLGINLKNELLKAKRIYDPKTDSCSHNLAERQQTTVVEINEKKFTIIQEMLFRERNLTTLKEKFLKAKVVIKGNPTDLEKRDSKKLRVKILYTKEFDTQESALNSNYLGIFGKIFPTSKTYLKP